MRFWDNWTGFPCLLLYSSVLIFITNYGVFMKFKKIVLAILLVLGVSFVCRGSTQVSALDTDTITLDDSDYRLEQDYLGFYSVSSQYFTYSNNGGSLDSNPLSNAFDGNFTTSFKSSQDNNVSYTDPVTGDEGSNFINTITVKFTEPVILDRIIYGAEYNSGSRGYPIDLNLYYGNGEGLSLIKNYKSVGSSSFVLFEFGEAIELSEFTFEYVEVSKNYKYVATAREIMFLQPESDMYDEYKDLFTDYTETTLSSNLNTYEKICDFEKTLSSNINFTGENEKISRAKEVSLGRLAFDSALEFSTSLDANNVIHRYGDIAGYCRNNLKTANFGTNRQVTGLLAKAGDKITIYVLAGESDPLPRIRFSQHIGEWRSWLSSEYQLKRGKNTFTAPNFITDNYSTSVVAGGSIYLCNPYTDMEQSSNVKVYIEGGTKYPVMMAGKDENVYKFELSKYASAVKNNIDSMVNITEIVTDHTIVTVDATVANDIYTNFSPNKTISNWNSYMDKLLEFGGITQDSSSPIFNEKNLNVNFNIRPVQQWASAWAYAASEHVGMPRSSQNSLVYGSGFGWGVTHEIGHMLDNGSRVISETTNNMYSKYNEAVIEGTATRGDYSATLEALVNDNTYSESSFFTNKTLNYLVWWYIETWHKGFWGELENCYRGLNTRLNEFYESNPDARAKVESLYKTEKQVFYASIVTGVDMSYYFDRWGYTIGNVAIDNVDGATPDPVFRKNTTSETFTNIMNAGVSAGYIDNTKEYKLWYQGQNAYTNTATEPTYSSATTVSIASVSKGDGKYTILINHNENANHLGYEILQGDDENGYKVIGFTYDNIYVDSSVYASGYTPKYKIVAIDNSYSASAMSEAVSFDIEEDVVCKIDDQEYSSLFDAITEAEDGDTITLLKSFSITNIVISKNITITVGDDVMGNIIISRNDLGNLITVSSGYTLNLLGKESSHIILDGKGFTQNGALLCVSGRVEASFVEFINNKSTGVGAIDIKTTNKNMVSSFINCVIKDNESVNGSAINIESAGATINISNMKIYNNKASGSGIIRSKGTMTINNSVIRNNGVGTGTIQNYDGGILTINDSTISNNTASTGAGLHIDGKTEINNTIISNNIATILAGGIYYSTSVGVRTLTLNGVTFTGNTANNGGDIYVSGTGSNINLNNVSTSDNSSMTFDRGNIKIKDDCNLHSNIDLSKNAKVYLVDGVFTGLSECTIDITDFEKGMTIFIGSNYEITNDILSIINIANNISGINLFTDRISLTLEENTVIAVPSKLEVSIVINGASRIYESKYGEEFSLDAIKFVSDTKYISKFTKFNSEDIEYFPNDKVLVQDNITLIAVIDDKVKIEFVYDDTIEVKYYIPYEEFNLPDITLNNKAPWGWKDLGSKVYAMGEQIVASSNNRYILLSERLFELNISGDNGLVYTGYYKAGEEVNLENLYNIKSHYLTLDGKVIDGKFVMQSDYTFTMVYRGLILTKWQWIRIAFASVLVFITLVFIGIYLYNQDRKR